MKERKEGRKEGRKEERKKERTETPGQKQRYPLLWEYVTMLILVVSLSNTINLGDVATSVGPTFMYVTFSGGSRTFLGYRPLGCQDSETGCGDLCIASRVPIGCRCVFCQVDLFPRFHMQTVRVKVSEIRFPATYILFNFSLSVLWGRKLQICSEQTN